MFRFEKKNSNDGDAKPKSAVDDSLGHKSAQSKKESDTLPPLPNSNVVIYDCLTGVVHRLGNQKLVFGASPDSDVNISSSGFKNREATILLERSGKRLQLSINGTGVPVEVNGAEFEGGLLKDQKELSLVIDNTAFFFIRIGSDAVAWGEKLRNSPPKSWQLEILKGDEKCYRKWKSQGMPKDFSGLHIVKGKTMLELIDETARRSWHDQTGLIYHRNALSGFFAKQFKSLSEPAELADAGEHRCPRGWMRFDTADVLSIHPSERGDNGPNGLGESELKRFTPTEFDANGTPLTDEGRACTRFACPHCRGELPPNFLEKAPHMLSIVGDSMSGKSYFLSVAVRQLKRIFPGQLGVNFTDADPAGNATLAKMIAGLFNPSQTPGKAFIGKTELAGDTYHEYQRHGSMVQLPRPFTYNLVSRDRRSSSSIVLYDNAGEHFRPGYLDGEKSNATEHLAWASGILYLFDPLQHRDLLTILHQDGVDPQIDRMMDVGADMNFDQDVILAEISERLKSWRQLSMGEAHDAPLALVVGKHDLLEELLPSEKLDMDVCVNGRISSKAIDANSEVTREFLIEYCPEIVGAAENISDNVKYFPASAFGSPAIKIEGVDSPDGGTAFGPDPKKLKPYLVEAPFLWILSEVEPKLISSE